VLFVCNILTGTYFSENALLPGLVKGEFDEDAVAKVYQSELLDEAARYPDGIPFSWLLAKFRQLNLDTYTHNFTLNSPLGLGVVRNIYIIIVSGRNNNLLL
jgi:glycosylphosphatidylinositol transamidase